MAPYFPGRDRVHLKNKYKKEEKENKDMIDTYLYNLIPLDPTLFMDNSGKFFFLLLPYNVFIIKLKFSNNRRFERRRKRKPR
jgi:hypothetical protein